MENQTFYSTTPSLNLFACRACLATDIKLFDIQDCFIAEDYEIVTGLSVPPDDGMPQHLCPYCFALLHKFNTFRKKCKRSLDILHMVKELAQPMSTEFIRIIDREGEKLTLSLSMHTQKGVDIKGTQLRNITNIKTNQFQRVSLEKTQELNDQDSEEEDSNEYTDVIHKEVPIDDGALEDNPFAVPGRKTFRSAARVPSMNRPSPPNKRRRRKTAGIGGEEGTHSSGYPGIVAAVKEAMSRRGTHQAVINMILSSLKPTTLQLYGAVYKQWWSFCTRNHLDPCEKSMPAIIQFFTEKLHRGLSVKVAKNQRGALALLLGKDISVDLDLRRVFQNFLNRKPGPKWPRGLTSGPWDPTLVLNHLSGWHPHNTLPIEQLSKKLVTLLALCTHHTANTLAMLNLDNISLQPEGVKILSQWLPYYRQDVTICPVRCLVDYLRASEVLRPDDCSTLIINVKKPHRGALNMTVMRWVHRTLVISGVDMSVFESKIERDHKPLNKSEFLSFHALRRQASCSERAAEFLKFYDAEWPSPSTME